MTLPADLPDSVIEVRFASGSWPTASFVDELVRAILVDRGAKMLVFVGADIVAAELASQSAASLAWRRDSPSSPDRSRWKPGSRQGRTATGVRPSLGSDPHLTGQNCSAYLELQPLGLVRPPVLPGAAKFNT